MAGIGGRGPGRWPWSRSVAVDGRGGGRWAWSRLVSVVGFGASVGWRGLGRMAWPGSVGGVSIVWCDRGRWVCGRDRRVWPKPRSVGVRLRLHALCRPGRGRGGVWAWLQCVCEAAVCGRVCGEWAGWHGRRVATAARRAFMSES